MPDEKPNEAAPVAKAAAETAAQMTRDAKPDAKAEPDGRPAPAEPAKLSLTEAELQARIDAALTAREAAAAAEAKRKQDEADAKAAAEKGEWQKLHDQQKAAREAAERDRDAAKLTAKSKDVDLAVRDHLAEKHPEYVGVAKYVRPLVPFDAATTDETIAKRVAEAAAQYVKDNPRSKAASAGAPAAPANGLRRPYDAASAALPPAPSPRRAFAHLYGRG